MHAPGHMSEVVPLSGDAKADVLVTPFVKGEMVASGAYCDTHIHDMSVLI